VQNKWLWIALAALLAVAILWGGRQVSLKAAEVSASENVEGEVPVRLVLSDTVDGITVEAGNFRVVGKYFVADFCYDRPSRADWLLGNPILESKDGASIPAFEIGLIEYISEGATPSGKRCDDVSFPIDEEIDLSEFSISVPKLEISWPEEFDCGAANVELETADTGILIECFTRELEGGGGYSGYEVVQRPEGISDEEMYALILAAYERAIGVQYGPWELQGQFAQ
jgi:hypothetical protein